MDRFTFNVGEEEYGGGDDFYEQIQAPKFVDLTNPDLFRSEDDDRYWFCDRVGCDQRHEEEMDSEVVYKNFVLRVMAARSPNVRFGKGLCRKHPSEKVRCPQSVPAKSSKSRVSRLAMISSVSQRLVFDKVKVKPILPRQKMMTPIGKEKQSSLSKALTTPHSAKNPKSSSIPVPKKAVKHSSPKKPVRTKTSINGMKNLEVANGKKPLEAPKKRLRVREVKSRVFDSLPFQNKEAKPVKVLKKKNKETDLQLPAPCECECLKMEVPLGETKVIKAENCLASRVMDSDDKENTSLSNVEQIKPSAEKEDTAKIIEVDEKKILVVKDSEVMESDDKENASSANENSKQNFNSRHMKSFLGKNETSKITQKVTKAMSKTSKGNSTCVEGLNNRKPKLTHPKPFRLRTDERSILKEANLEKKMHLLEPLKEVTTCARFQGGGNPQRKHQIAAQLQRKEQMECASSDAHEGTSKAGIERNQSKILHRRTQKTNIDTARARPAHMQATTQAMGRRHTATPKEPHFRV